MLKPRVRPAFAGGSHGPPCDGCGEATLAAKVTYGGVRKRLCAGCAEEWREMHPAVVPTRRTPAKKKADKPLTEVDRRVNERVEQLRAFYSAIEGRGAEEMERLGRPVTANAALSLGAALAKALGLPSTAGDVPFPASWGQADRGDWERSPPRSAVTSVPLALPTSEAIEEHDDGDGDDDDDTPAAAAVGVEAGRSLEAGGAGARHGVGHGAVPALRQPAAGERGRGRRVVPAGAGVRLPNGGAKGAGAVVRRAA